MNGEGLSASDVALLSDKNGGVDWSSNSFMWIFALLILAGGGFGNWNNNNGGGGYQPQYATQDFVQNGFNFNDLQQQHWGLFESGNRNTSTIIDAINESEVALAKQNGTIQTSAQAIAANQAQCCCDTQKAIMNSDMLNMQNLAQINERIMQSDQNTTAQTQKILDAITGNEMNRLQNEVNQLRLQSEMCGVLRMPTQMTYCAGQFPPMCNCGGCANM